MKKVESKKAIYKLMTDLDKTFQPAKELDRENLVILAQQIENSGARLDITPITGRPIGYVPAILEQTNQLFAEYDLAKPCKFGYGESGMIQAIPVLAEYQKFIFSHNPKIINDTKLIHKKVYDLLEKKYDMKLERDFLTDSNRQYSIVIQPLEHRLESWKGHVKEEVIKRLSADPEIGNIINCFRNDAEAIQIDHKALNKSKTLAFDLLGDIKNGEKIHSLAFSCDGDNDFEAAKWVVEFAASVKEAKNNLKKDLSLKDAMLPVIKMFNGFIPIIDKEMIGNLITNIRDGFENINVFLPEKAHPSLIKLKNDNPDIVLQSDKRVLTGVLDCMSKQWKYPLDLSYNSVYKQMDNSTANFQKRKLMKKINEYRRLNLDKIDKNLEIANKKLEISVMIDSDKSTKKNELRLIKV